MREGWIEHDKDGMMPSWLKSSLSSTCPYCGKPMVNFYNKDYRCTNRACSDFYCPSVVAKRGEFILKLIGVKGIGFAKCLEYSQSADFSNHLRYLGILSEKPTIPLDVFLRMHCFQGIDSQWEVVVKNCDAYSLDDLFNSYFGDYRPILEKNKELLYDNLKYVNLTQRPVQKVGLMNRTIWTIMITGTPNGFNSKEEFINYLNGILNGYITIIHQKTKKQSGVDFLIREPGSKTKGKVDAAIKGGIPIVTSEQFYAILLEEVSRIKTELGES